MKKGVLMVLVFFTALIVIAGPAYAGTLYATYDDDNSIYTINTTTGTASLRGVPLRTLVSPGLPMILQPAPCMFVM